MIIRLVAINEDIKIVNSISKSYFMRSLKEFFIFCSGSNQSILDRTPTEVNKYAGIGATIFFTGLFAMLAGGFAIYTVFSILYRRGSIWCPMGINDI